MELSMKQLISLHLVSRLSSLMVPYFSSSSESVILFTMIHQVTSSVSSFSECLKLLSDFCHIFVDPNDGIQLAVSDTRPSRKHIYLFVLPIGVLPSEFVALHLPEMHDETRKQITICNDDCKFAVYLHGILQECIVKNMVMVMIYFEMFSLETVNLLHARHTCPIRVLRRITFITNELNFPWDLGINSIFSGADSTLSTVCAFSDLPSTAVDLLRRPVPPPPNVLNVGCRPNVGRQNVISDCGFRGNFGDICPISVSISEVIYII